MSDEIEARNKRQQELEREHEKRRLDEADAHNKKMQEEYEAREREHERRRRQEPLMVMAAIVASGFSNQEIADSSIADRAVRIAKAIYDKVQALP